MKHVNTLQTTRNTLVGLAVLAACLAGQRAHAGYRILSVRPGPEQTVARAEALAAGAEPAPATVTYPHPVPPFLGFTPLVALTTSNSRTLGDFQWEHVLRNGYYGSPLNSPADVNYTIGIFDSGATMDMVPYCDAITLGFYDASGNPRPTYLTNNTTELGGASGSVLAYLSQPVGYFAGGLSAIKPDGKLDLTKLVGHTNVSVVVGMPEICGDGPEVPSVAGNPLVSFYTTVMRNDLPRRATFLGQTAISPDLQIYSPGNPAIPTYPRKITMNVGGVTGPYATSSYNGDFEDFVTPYLIPTVLSSYNTAFSIGGAFYGTMYAAEGEPSPTNPAQAMRVMIDTGAQTCIMTPAMAADLSLSSTPDFYVEVLGSGGVQSDVPGYFIDYVKINALGGAFEFSHVPFVVIDFPQIDLEPTQAIMGMNLFWNRNVIFQPSLSGSGFLQISDPPLQFAKADFNRDFLVDGLDFDTFRTCVKGPSVTQGKPECFVADLDEDTDVDSDDFGIFQRCFSGQLTADVNCGQ